MRALRTVAAVMALAALVAGAGCRRKPPPPPSPAVATFEGGSITAADVDRAVLDLSPDQRQPADGDLLRWYEGVARDLAIQRILLTDARRAGFEKDADFGRAREEARRHAMTTVFIEKTIPSVPAPTPKEIEAFYRAHATDFRRPAARQAYHLFLRVAPGSDPAAAMAEAGRLRARVLAGEDFATLAGQRSDSQSRHQKGLLGWVSPGQLSPELERVIFSLQPKVPSPPLKTREGVHLFLVDTETPAKTLTLAEVRAAITRRLMIERRDAEIDRVVGTAVPPGSFVPTTEELRGLFEAADPKAVVLRIGDFQVTLWELQQRILGGQLPAEAIGEDSRAHALVEALERRELIYRYAVAKGMDRGPEVAERMTRLTDRELAGLQLRKLLLERTDRDPKRLEDYYQANRGRFSLPLRLRVQRLSVPLTGSANEVMARLERARAGLDAGSEDFAGLAAAVGGTLLDPVWEVPSQLAARQKAATPPAADLKPGRHSPPYRAGDRIEMARVLERREPEPMPFERVRDQVRADFLINHRHDEYAAVAAEVLKGRNFRVVQGELEGMLKRPLAAGS